MNTENLPYITTHVIKNYFYIFYEFINNIIHQLTKLKLNITKLHNFKKKWE